MVQLLDKLVLWTPLLLKGYAVFASREHIDQVVWDHAMLEILHFILHSLVNFSKLLKFLILYEPSLPVNLAAILLEITLTCRSLDEANFLPVGRHIVCGVATLNSNFWTLNRCVVIFFDQNTFALSSLLIIGNIVRIFSGCDCGLVSCGSFPRLSPLRRSFCKF